MSESEKFVERLCTCVRPSMFVRRSGQEIVILLKRNRRAFAVDFRRAWDQDAFAVSRAKSEYDIRSAKDRLDRSDRALHDELHADSARHVINAIGFADQLFHQPFVEYRIDDQAKTLGVLEVRDV